MLIMDASFNMWGTHVQGEMVQGTWYTKEPLHSINVLELTVLSRGLLAFQDLLSNNMSWFTQTT